MEKITLKVTFSKSYHNRIGCTKVQYDSSVHRLIAYIHQYLNIPLGFYDIKIHSNNGKIVFEFENNTIEFSVKPGQGAPTIDGVEYLVTLHDFEHQLCNILWERFYNREEVSKT